MQEINRLPPPSTENIPLHPPGNDPSGVHRFPMGDNNTSAPGDSPTKGPPPVSSLEDLKGKLVSEAMDPYGCKFLHQKLQERKQEDIQMIFSEVKDHICRLMLNQLGSDLLQKLYEVCDEEQMTQLVSSATADVRLLVDVCLDSQGSESMQEFIGLMTRKQMFHMISFFTYFMVPLVNNQFGSRVIGHFFNIFPAPADETEPIVNVIADNFLEIAKDENGSCLLQVIISKGSIPTSHSRQRILSAITLEVDKLSMDQFGSRVLQHVIGLEMPFVVSRIVDKLQGLSCFLARDKYGSNVVKQLMEASKGKYSSQIANDIISSPNFLSVLVDPYGYSVIQSAQTYSNGIVRKTLDRLICKYSDLLDEYSDLLDGKRKSNHV